MSKEFLNNLFNKVDCVLIKSRPNSFYLSSYNSSFSYIVIYSKDCAVFYTDSRYFNEAKNKVKFNNVSFKNTSVELLSNDLLKEENFFKYLNDKFKGKKRIGVEFNLEYRTIDNLKTIMKNKEIIDISSDFYGKREQKTENEIKNIIKAFKIAEKSFNEVLKTYIKEGVTEKEIKNILEYLMVKNGADDKSFDSIVAFGKNSSFPHAHATNYKLKNNDIITIDFGAIYNGYASDTTRTFAFGGITSEQKKIYQAVLDVNKRSIDRVSSKITGHELNKLAINDFKELKYDKFFTHSLGHGVGIEVHEQPYLSKSAPINHKLVKNSVITIEPGLYLDTFGVRIEDMVLVAENGCVNLTSSLNKELLVI